MEADIQADMNEALFEKYLLILGTSRARYPDIEADMNAVRQAR